MRREYELGGRHRQAGITHHHTQHLPSPGPAGPAARRNQLAASGSRMVTSQCGRDHGWRSIASLQADRSVAEPARAVLLAPRGALHHHHAERTRPGTRHQLCGSPIRVACGGQPPSVMRIPHSC